MGRRVGSEPVRGAESSADVTVAAQWGDKYPAICRLWDPASSEFVPLVLDYSLDIRRVIYSTKAIGSLNARKRRATRARGHFPNEQATLKCLYLAIRVASDDQPTIQPW